MTSPLDSCRVEVEPSVVDAGAELTLRGAITGSPASVGQGLALEIVDEDGVVTQTVDVSVPGDGGGQATWESSVRAPARPGSYTWRVVHPVSPPSSEPPRRARTLASFAFDVRPHRPHVSVWGLPSAVAAGESFTITVGAKCPGSCPLDGSVVEIADDQGSSVATTTLGDTPWPGTSGLAYAKVELRAPDAVGALTWKARVSAAGDLPHVVGDAPFGVRVMPAPEHVLRIVAVDVVDQTPVAGARVVVHPYRRVTGEDGVAEVGVPAGDYRVFVSGRGYAPFRRDGTVTADTTIRAELTARRELTDADIWS